MRTIHFNVVCEEMGGSHKALSMLKHVGSLKETYL
jgi:hypothetical protein